MSVHQTPFLMVPLWVYNHPDVTRTTMQAYLALRSFTYKEGSWEGTRAELVRRLIEEAGLSRTGAYETLALLESIRALVWRDQRSAWMPLDNYQEWGGVAAETPAAVAQPAAVIVEELYEPLPAPARGAEHVRVEVEPDPPAPTRAVQAQPARSVVVGPDPLRGFEEFWQRWPMRNGKRLHKNKAQGFWRKMSLEEKRAAYRAAANYALACDQGTQGRMDAFRWLRDRLWEEWQEPPAGVGLGVKRGSSNGNGQTAQQRRRAATVAAIAPFMDRRDMG